MQSLLHENEYYQSSDLALVATLCCYGYRIETVDKNNPSRAIFYIPRDKGIDDLTQAYWAHKLQVDPLVYFASLKEAKSRLYGDDIR